jgi:hypothetical protein
MERPQIGGGRTQRQQLNSTSNNNQHCSRIPSTSTYDQGEFASLAAGAGLRGEQTWTDDRSLFTVEHLVRD